MERFQIERWWTLSIALVHVRMAERHGGKSHSSVRRSCGRLNPRLDARVLASPRTEATASVNLVRWGSKKCSTSCKRFVHIGILRSMTRAKISACAAFWTRLLYMLGDLIFRTNTFTGTKKYNYIKKSIMA